jgi:hypothetical protein
MKDNSHESSLLGLRIVLLNHAKHG